MKILNLNKHKTIKKALHFKTIGYWLIIIAICGYCCSLYLEDSMMRMQIICLAGSVISILLAALFLKVYKEFNTESYIYTEQSYREHYVVDGEKILITLNNCELKGNTYREEIINERINKSAVLDELYNPMANVSYNNVSHSVIIYNYEAGNHRIQMISNTYNMSIEKLRLCVNDGKVNLMIDNMNQNNYCYIFDGRHTENTHHE